MLYFDPDIEIFGDVGHLAELAEQHGVVVTPHHLRPLPRDGRTPTEADFLARGIYNLGFIGTGLGAVDSGFLEFWRERLERDGIVDYANMMFTDQWWIDFIDCFPASCGRRSGLQRGLLERRPTSGDPARGASSGSKVGPLCSSTSAGWIRPDPTCCR